MGFCFFIFLASPSSGSECYLLGKLGIPLRVKLVVFVQYAHSPDTPKETQLLVSLVHHRIYLT